MVQGYLNAKIFKNGPGSYTIRDYGKCLTVRFDSKINQPDLIRSTNVLGYRMEPQGLYISLAPGTKEATIVLSDKAGLTSNGVSRPYLSKASGWVNRFEVQHKEIKIDYQGHGKGKIEISNLKPKTLYQLSSNVPNGFPVSKESDQKGVLSIKGGQTGTIKITWQ